VRIVIFGATGNLGTSLLESLGNEGRVTDIVGVARRLPATEYAKTTFTTADIACDDLAPVLRGADAVVHLAWLFQPSHDPMTTWRVNAVGTRRLLDAVSAAGIRTVVYSSSIGAYSPGVGRVVDESWSTDSVPTAAYGREKAYVERVLDAFEARHPQTRVVRLRPAFIFKRAASTGQRRLFAGPFLPRPLLERGRLPIVPVPKTLRFQAVHSSDVGRALQLAIVNDVRGAFNIAADPVIDAESLGAVLDTRPVPVPRVAARAALALAWHLHVLPVEPTLLDLFLQLPLIDTTRARTELGWTPRFSGLEALREAIEGMRAGAGIQTAPLAPDSFASRAQEVATGVGERDRLFRS
jgi:UDP-glucose 4-epimerase